jgi:transcriptional regulator with XRE-family HTH domain
VSTKTLEKSQDHSRAEDIEGGGLRILRQALGMTLRGMAEQVGCFYQHLTRMESGERFVSPDIAVGISRTLANRLNKLNEA